MFKFIVLLLILWVVISIIGFAVKGLIWLAFIGIVLFVVTGFLGWRRRASADK